MCHLQTCVSGEVGREVVNFTGLIAIVPGRLSEKCLALVIVAAAEERLALAIFTKVYIRA